MRFIAEDVRCPRHRDTWFRSYEGCPQCKAEREPSQPLTAEQKLEKCKELVEKWRKDSALATDMGYPHEGIGYDNCANELQAVLEETDE